MARFFMARWMPLANTNNYNPAHRIKQPLQGLVLHITNSAGVLGTKGHFEAARADKSSAHFCCPRVRNEASPGGALTQFIDTDVVAYAQGAVGDNWWVSIENEGKHGQELTPYQVEMCAYVLAWLYLNQEVPEEYGFSLRVANTVDDGGLADHSMFGGTGCPGTAVINQKPLIVNRARAIVASPAQYALQWP